MDRDARKTNNKIAALLGLVVVGFPVFMLTFYALIVQTYFVYRATALEASIVDVQVESVPKGKGSTVGFIPVVEIPDQSGNKVRTKVDTYNEQPVFRIGDKMQLLCDRSSLKCIEHTFFEAWGKSALNFAGSIVLVLVLIIILRRV